MRVRSVACPVVAGSEGACRRTPCAERAVMAHSSPEPAAGWVGGADPYGVLCSVVGNRGYREWLAGPPAIHRSSLWDGGFWGEGLVGRGLVGALRAQREL